MNKFKLVAMLGVVVSIGAGSGACRKRPARTASPAATETAPASAPTASPVPAAAPAPVPALSARDEAEIRKRYVPAEIPWVKRSPDQKQLAYLGWCQIYMLGDAATKTKVLAEIRQAGLSAEDVEALKKKNRDMRIPLMPL